MIKIENLHKKFGDTEVLKGIDLEVKKGEVVAIIGPSGTCLLYTSPSPRD